MQLPRLIAHRGASAVTPENTIAAMCKAKDLGVDWIECDVQLTIDNEPVIFHDDNLDRTTDGEGLLAEKTLAELKQLDAGSWFASEYSDESIPSLDELLQCLDQQGLSMNLELKSQIGTEQQLIDRVDDLLDRHWPEGLTRPLISSFNWQVLYLMQQKNSTHPLAILMHDWREDWLEHAKALNSVSVNLQEALLTAERVREIKSAGFGILAYTVNDRARAKQLYDWGVDGLFTDQIDVIKSVVLI